MHTARNRIVRFHATKIVIRLILSQSQLKVVAPYYPTLLI